MKLYQNTKEKKNKYHRTKIYYIDLTENFKSYITGFQSVLTENEQ